MALAGLAALPAPQRAGLDETTAPTLTAITGAYRRLEAGTPAYQPASAAGGEATSANQSPSHPKPSPPARTHASERVIAKAREFRRACTAQPAAALRAFDQQLREAMPR